jgi:hypothetical protein
MNRNSYINKNTILVRGYKFMNRKAYDEKIIKNISCMDIDFEHPDWTQEQKNIELNNPSRRAKTVRNLTILDLSNRLFEEHGGTYTARECAAEAKYLMENMPQELIVNVNEWLDNKPLSDIKVHGTSINDVFKMFVNRPMHFIRILHCMCKWKETDYFDEENFCWCYFAR